MADDKRLHFMHIPKTGGSTLQTQDAMPKTHPKTIWTCWFQGRENAPEVVKYCLASWEERNPSWELRCLDKKTIGHYVNLDPFIDLNIQKITPASLSDIIRMLLLHEYGGVWVDATLFCNEPLDEWLAGLWDTGFFAFHNEIVLRTLASWFLACKPGNNLLAKWVKESLAYWKCRQQSTDYFWLHHQFTDLCIGDAEAKHAWESIPRISSDGPHSLQMVMYEDTSVASSRVNWETPVFKLTHRINEAAYRPGTMLYDFLARSATKPANKLLAKQAMTGSPVMKFTGLSVGTENLENHIQIIAANCLLQRVGIIPAPLTLLYKRRLLDPELQTQTYVVSRDQTILSHLPKILENYHYLSHSDSSNFNENMLRADHLLTLYKTRAKLIVTTSPHCALTAIAMGIPVVVFYPPNSSVGHESDRERFSSLSYLIRVFHLTEVADVDWRGYTTDVSYLKLKFLDDFYKMARRSNLPAGRKLGPLALPETLPPPSVEEERKAYEYERQKMRPVREIEENYSVL